jgi:predicted nuclease of predicted toxin-antitoxin system
MILADENIFQDIIKALREAGFEVYSIYENQRGTKDVDIVQLSKNPPRIILTEDKDFGDLVFAHQHKDISVILLRYTFSETDTITTILMDLLRNKTHDLWGKFTTVTTKKVRIRNI